MTDRLQDVIASAIYELEEEYRTRGNEPYFEDTLSEIADSNTPIYNNEIMQIAADNIDLATNEPEFGPAFDGRPTPINIIAANIYDRIYEAVSQRYEELKEHKCAKEDETKLSCTICGWDEERYGR